QYDHALNTLRQAIAIAEACSFNADRARSWYILGDVYRESKDFTSSIHYQNQSIDFFTKIGARYELAESHYYLGLTYQDMDNWDAARHHWQQALIFFRQMSTPRQVSKVLAHLEGKS
ncbi:MAG TPA: tetratricopeptide repeat protein, partial [Candidatus Obscuribacterales bacterium]